MLVKQRIKNVPYNIKKPLSNAIHERMHLTIVNVLQVYMSTSRIKMYDKARQVLDNTLAVMMYVPGYTVNHTMKNSPGKIV